MEENLLMLMLHRCQEWVSMILITSSGIYSVTHRSSLNHFDLPCGLKREKNHACQQAMVIAKKVRELLGIEEPYWNRSISLLHREPLGLFLEKKGKTGTEADLLTFEDYKRQLKRQEKSKETKTAFNIL
ncbi:uncharacterized protein LOC114960209 isoform X3 [Acropora millepora]|uniref:uncharacterized protein LOC114960209 isoform X3 n=1 Tax=Acropora millepora TaxID=45264 RepID=UPI001CF1CD83|nr:uncharacterized protein LOC114960209 isoform X3 [Acropora millepora]